MLSEMLKDARDAKGMTRKQLSDASGVTINTIAAYENYDVEPTFFNLCCIAQVLDLDLNYLAGRTETGAEALQNKIFELNREAAALHRKLAGRFRAERECIKLLRKKG